MTNTELREIVRMVSESRFACWHGYDYETDAQSLSTLACPWGRYEVQLNRIRHGLGAHTHDANLVSLILDGGYGWWLRQAGGRTDRYQFSAPGSLVTLGPHDAHWIERNAQPSLSLCVFDRPFDWHLEKPALPEQAANQILWDVQAALRNMVKIPELRSAA